MMDIVSLELCKELYELSGWTTNMVHYCQTRLEPAVVPAERIQKYGKFEVQHQTIEIFPAYNAGFLLRKLPEEIEHTKLILTNGERPHAGYAGRGNYGNYALDESFYSKAQYADTPGDALCKLAIKLFKSGILVK